MRSWFLATVFVTLALAEISLGPALTTSSGAGPDLLFPLLVYVALSAPWTVSPLFYWGLGSFSDLFAVPRPGLRGFTYLMVALAIERLSPGRSRRNPILHGTLAAGGSLLVETVYLLAARSRWPGGLSAGITVAIHSALLTGLAGLLLAFPLNLTSRLFGWPPTSGALTWKQLMAAAAAGTRLIRRARGH